jgi:hypothetical protein
MKTCRVQFSRVVPFVLDEPSGHVTRFQRKAARICLESRAQFRRARERARASGGEIGEAASGGTGVEPSRQREGAICFYMLSCRQPGQTDRDCGRSSTSRGCTLNCSGCWNRRTHKFEGQDVALLLESLIGTECHFMLLSPRLVMPAARRTVPPLMFGGRPAFLAL